MPKSKKGVKKGLPDRKKNAVVREYRKFLKKKKGRRKREKEFFRREFQDYDTVKQRAMRAWERVNTPKMSFFDRAFQEYEAVVKQREREMQLRDAKRMEREEAMRKYEEKKRENFKKLSRKTKWGQPVMSGRIEILLERIQKSVKIED